MEGRKKIPSNNVCWRRRAEAITENTFRQIANMRSKVTVESEGSNITSIWLIATATRYRGFTADREQTVWVSGEEVEVGGGNGSISAR